MLKRYLIYTSIVVSGLIFVLLFVNPTSLPSSALFAVFALIYVSIALSIICLLMIVRKIFERKWVTGIIRRVGFSTALLPTFLLLLQSVGQLTVRDAVLACILTSLAYMYSHRMFTQPHGSDISG